MATTPGRGESLRFVALLAFAGLMIAFASILLQVSFSFGYTAGEIMVNPNAHAEDKLKLERAAEFAFTLFIAVQVALAFLMVMSGLLKKRLHVALRAIVFLIGGLLASSLPVVLSLETGLLPSPLAQIASATSDWIQTVTSR